MNVVKNIKNVNIEIIDLITKKKYHSHQKEESSNSADDFAFFEIKKDVDVKRIVFFENDSMYEVMQKIHYLTNIPIKYQLLLNLKYEPISFIEGTKSKINIRELLDMNYIYNGSIEYLQMYNQCIYQTIYIIAIDKLIEKQNQFMSEYKIQKYWNKFIKYLWPRLNFFDIKNVNRINRDFSKVKSKEKFYSDLFFNTDKIDILIDDTKTINKKWITEVSKHINLYEMFVTLNLSELIKIIIFIKDNESFMFKVDKSESHSIKVPENFNKKYIKINTGIYIFENIVISTNKKIYDIILDIIKTQSGQHKTIYKKIFFKVDFVGKKFNLKGFKKFIIKSKYSTLITEKFLFKNVLSFFGGIIDVFLEKKYEKYFSVFDDYVMDSIFIYPLNDTIINVLIQSSKPNSFVEKIINIICRILHVYRKECINHDNSLNFYKPIYNLKLVDPKLYTIDKATYKYKPFSRLISKDKHPIVFTEKSKIGKRFINSLKLRKIHHNIEIRPNYTFTNTKSIYICVNPYNVVNKIGAFYHPRKLQYVCCNKKEIIKSKKQKNKKINNKYYIRQYTDSKILKKEKFSYLSISLDFFLNENILKNTNYLLEGFRRYILRGMESDSIKTILLSLFGHDTFFDVGSTVIIFRIDNKLNTTLDLTFNKLFYISNIKRNTKLYIFLISENNIYQVVELISLFKKEFKLKEYFQKNDKITKKIIYLLNNIKIYRSVSQNELILEDIIKTNIEYKQIYIPNTTKIERLLMKFDNEYFIFPIKETFLHPDLPFIEISKLVSKYKKYDISIIKLIKFIKHINKLLNKKIKIKKINKNFQNIYNSILLDNGNFVSINSTTQNKYKFPIKFLYYRKSNKSINVTNENILSVVELYWIYVLHFSTKLNEINNVIYEKIRFADIEQIKKKLIKIWGNDSNSNYIADMNYAKYFKYNKMTAIKKNKLEFIELFETKPINLLKIKKFVQRLSKAFVNISEIKQNIKKNKIFRRVCVGSGGGEHYTLKGQCRGEKLNISRTHLNTFIELLSIELLKNKSRRRDIRTGDVFMYVNNEFDIFNYSDGDISK